MRALLAIIAGLVLPSLAQAADLTVTVRNGQGRPVADAVVSVYPSAPYDRRTIRFPWPNRVTQHDLRFDPFVIIVPVGAEVSFPNLDNVRHHVYSFSPAKTFELKLYGHDETRTVRFDKVGVAALGCNIHDQMAAFVVVVDTPFAGKTDAGGQVTLRGVPGDQARMQVWHPYAKARDGRIEQSVSLAGATQAVTLDVRPAPRRGAY